MALTVVATVAAGCSATRSSKSSTSSSSTTSSELSLYIPSCANYPTLQPGYHIVLQEPLKGIRHGDFVVFHSPLSQIAGATAVSRVVGLPGETIQAADGHVLIDNHVLAEPYLAPGTRTADFGPVSILSRHYFLLGDNRSNPVQPNLWRADER
ncbi:MAG TPA: signal peptidase I [Acidimicrobiales bacterium]|nr:signal peptidase I [Acidimicrobiales bacterium]